MNHATKVVCGKSRLFEESSQGIIAMMMLLNGVISSGAPCILVFLGSSLGPLPKSVTFVASLKDRLNKISTLKISK